MVNKMENNRTGHNELNTDRRAFVLQCLDSPPEQHLAAMRQGCKSFFAIWVKRRKGQSVCPFCKRRQRWNVENETSHSAAVIQGPLLDRQTAKGVALRLSSELSAMHAQQQVEEEWF